MRTLIDVANPQRIFHLAAQSFVPLSWNTPAEAFSVNTKGTLGQAYNISSRTTRTIQSVLDIPLGLSRVDKVRQQPARLPPSDVSILRADDSKFRALTGWAPEIPFGQTMHDLLDYRRERVDHTNYD